MLNDILALMKGKVWHTVNIRSDNVCRFQWTGRMFFFQYPGLTTAQQLAPDNEQDV